MTLNFIIMQIIGKRKKKVIKRCTFLLCMLLCIMGSCSDNKETTREVNTDCLYDNLAVMQHVLDTATIGNEDGMFPQENADELLASIDELKMGISKALADMFILQYEADNYCVAADKALNSFFNSQQLTMYPGEEAELLVYGIDQKGYIDFGESPLYGSSNVFTVESWLKYDEGFFEYAIADFIATFDGRNPSEGWMINFSGSNLRMTLAMGPDASNVLETGSAYPANYGQWMHIAVVYNENAASEQLKCYINGDLFFVKTNDVQVNGTLQSYNPNTRSYKMYGFMEPVDNSRCMTGYMKKFRLWHTAKSQNEVQALMNTEVNGNEAGLVCAWDFTIVPDDDSNIPDKTGQHTAKLVGSYKWKPVPTE
ncbi:MAG: LamG domain-containing protein [Tannerellaceae bacterium]|nr:LamG domain-containing protein [Tannerellaceae bacterium]